MIKPSFMSIVFVLYAMVAFGGCNTAIYEVLAGREAVSGKGMPAQKADQKKYESVLPLLSESCEVDPKRMDYFIRDFHEQITSNHVRDTFIVTVVSYYTAVTGALKVQERYGFDRGPLETCQQVAKDYGFSRRRDWIKRRQPASHTVQTVIRLIEHESQGSRVRRIY